MPFPSRPPGGAPGNAARKSQAHARAATQVDLIFEIFKTFGLPSSDGFLVQLPNYPAEPPNWVVGKDDWRRAFSLEAPEEEDVLAMLSGLFELEPGARTTPTQAMSGGCFSYLTPDLRCRALVCEAPAARGPVSLVQGAVGRRTLSWLQSDPYWAELPQKVGAPKTHKVCHAASENEVKHEEGGHTRTQAPSTLTCNVIDCSAPCPAVRVGAFAKALVACNRGWLVQLTQEVRSELRKFPKPFISKNGEHFMTSCFSDTVFAYAILQVMTPGERHDPERYDGGRLALARWTDDIRQTGLGDADSGGGSCSCRSVSGGGWFACSCREVRGVAEHPVAGTRRFLRRQLVRCLASGTAPRRSKVGATLPGGWFSCRWAAGCAHHRHDALGRVCPQPRAWPGAAVPAGRLRRR